MLAKRWIGNVPMMVKVYRWCRGCHSPRAQALRLAWGFRDWKYALVALAPSILVPALPGSVKGTLVPQLGQRKESE